MSVGLLVGFGDGESVGSVTGATVGWLIGEAVGLSLGDLVGFVVGSGVSAGSIKKNTTKAEITIQFNAFIELNNDFW